MEQNSGAPPAGVEQEKQALRIQAAAVAAQQAALTEEEMRLQRRRVELDQQEQQLAGHLEEKRRRLIRLRAEVREEHSALEQARAASERRVAQSMAALTQARRELSDGQRQVEIERRHLLELRHRLKRRFHRHWAGERMTLRLREAKIATQARTLQAARDRLQQEKDRLSKGRMQLNGEMELGRRRLQADQEQLRKGQAELLARTNALQQREAALNQRERDVAGEKQHWEHARFQLHQEAQGLETRIANARRKLVEQEQELSRLQGVLDPTAKAKTPEPTANAALAPAPEPAPVAVLPLSSPAQQPQQKIERREAALRNGLALLQRLAGDLADQRLYLAEQFERLGYVQLQWQQDRQALALDLEALGQRLRRHEQVLQIREQEIRAAEDELHERCAQWARRQRELESSSARLAVDVATWEGERHRVMAHLRAREGSLERQLAAMNDLRERWSKRRQRQIGQLRARRRWFEELRRETEAMRQEWVRRSTLLAKQERTLAERALALEQYRQRWIAQASHPKAAEKRLERFRRRLAGLTASAERALVQERKSLEVQVARLEERKRQVQQDMDELTVRESTFTAQQAARGQQQLQEQAEHEKLRREVQGLRKQRRSYEQIMASLRDEVERLARLLFDEADPAPPPMTQAA
jgi:chromosome segregation ATPase